MRILAWILNHLHAIVVHGPAIVLFPLMLLGPRGLRRFPRWTVPMMLVSVVILMIVAVITGQRLVPGNVSEARPWLVFHEAMATLLVFMTAGFAMVSFLEKDMRKQWRIIVLIGILYLVVVFLGVHTAHP